MGADDESDPHGRSHRPGAAIKGASRYDNACVCEGKNRHNAECYPRMQCLDEALCWGSRFAARDADMPQTRGEFVRGEATWIDLAELLQLALNACDEATRTKPGADGRR